MNSDTTQQIYDIQINIQYNTENLIRPLFPSNPFVLRSVFFLSYSRKMNDKNTQWNKIIFILMVEMKIILDPIHFGTSFAIRFCKKEKGWQSYLDFAKCSFLIFQITWLNFLVWSNSVHNRFERFTRKKLLCN